MTTTTFDVPVTIRVTLDRALLPETLAPFVELAEVLGSLQEIVTASLIDALRDDGLPAINDGSAGFLVASL